MSRMNQGGAFVATLLAILAVPMEVHAVVSNTQPEASRTPASVIAFNQKPKNDQIIITYAYLPTNGYLTIYEGGKNGARGDKVMGRSELKAGDHRNVAVKLDSIPPKGSALWVSLSNESKESYWPKTLPLENELMVE